MTDPTLPTRLSQCGREFAVASVSALTTPEGLNLPSVVAGCARMSGTYLFRSFGLSVEHVEPGAPVLSAPAAEQTPLLLQVCAGALRDLGTAVPDSPPAELAEPGHQPRLTFLETQAALDAAFAPIRERHALDDRQSAMAAAIGTGILIHSLAKHLDPGIGFGVAAFAFTEGTRTMPAPRPGAPPRATSGPE